MRVLRYNLRGDVVRLVLERIVDLSDNKLRLNDTRRRSNWLR